MLRGSIQLARHFAFLALAFMLLAAPCQAQLHTLGMPLEFRDYAMHAETGDMAAVGGGDGQVWFFRAADLAAGKTDAWKKIPSGRNAKSICFKRYQDKDYYVMACAGEAALHFIDAGTGDLVRKATIATLGAEYVTCSPNPADPFVYYQYRKLDERAYRAVSIRDFKDKGSPYAGLGMWTFSASGEFVYRNPLRDAYNKSEVLKLFGQFTDNQPVYRPHLKVDELYGPFIADPFDKYVACAGAVYSADGKELKAKLTGRALCFFKSPPILVTCAIEDERGEWRKWMGAFQALSCNTLQPIGESIPSNPVKRLNADAAEKAPAFPVQVVAPGDEPRIFADEKNARVVHVKGKELAFLPLAGFKLPEQPTLIATLRGDRKLLAGREYRFTVDVSSDKAEVRFPHIPDGMTVAGRELTWRPSLEQVGPTRIVVELRQNDLKVPTAFDLTVESPYVELPFQPAEIEVDPAGRRALIWGGPEPTPYIGGRNAGARPEQPLPCALIDLATGKVLAEHRLPEYVTAAVVQGDRVIMAVGIGTSRCEVRELPSFKLVKSFDVEGSIRTLERLIDCVCVRTDVGYELYDPNTFARKQAWDIPQVTEFPVPATTRHTREGPMIEGCLFGMDRKARLMVTPSFLPHELRFEQYWLPRSIRASLPSMDDQALLRRNKPVIRGSLDGAARVGMVVEGIDSSMVVTLEYDVEGVATAKQVVAREPLTIPPQEAGKFAKLRLSANDAFVTFDRKLLRWPLPPPKANVSGEGPRFAVRQSAFGIDPRGKTTLTHTVTGGQGPYTFAVPKLPAHVVVGARPALVDAVTLDDKTGAVTVDGAAFAEYALESIAWASQDRGTPQAWKFAAMERALHDRATAILGRPAEGIPFAIPIRIEVTDARGDTDKLQYFVLLEAPREKVLEQFKKPLRRY